MPLTSRRVKRISHFHGYYAIILPVCLTPSRILRRRLLDVARSLRLILIIYATLGIRLTRALPAAVEMIERLPQLLFSPRRRRVDISGDDVDVAAVSLS